MKSADMIKPGSGSGIRHWTFALFCLLLFSVIQAQEKKKILIDTLDGKLDFTRFVLEADGVLPIISPITEPAVGYGGFLAAVYFIPKEDPTHRPDMVLAGGGLTSNGSWLAGGGYIGYWKADHIRYQGFAGYGEFNLSFFTRRGRELEFELKSFSFIQRALFRLRGTNFFLGGEYKYAKVDIPLFAGNNIIDPIDLNLVNSGISLITAYDSRNNPFSPSEGLKLHLSYEQNFEFLGSTKDWGRLNFHTYWYWPVSESYIPALRLDGSLVTDSTPFYARPDVYMRGIPALRYQGQVTGLIETEHLYNFDLRWSGVGFAGMGAAFQSLDNFVNDEVVWSVGGGFRYLLARGLGLRAGADIARGPEDWAFYITVGSAWLR